RVMDKDGKARNKKHKPRKGEVEEETNKSISFIIPPTAPRPSRSFRSAPTPPRCRKSNHPGSDSKPYNTFLPNVSLTLPMNLVRRSANAQYLRRKSGQLSM
ncbi:slightly ste11-like protein, partial [Paramarasmius palmivorus]